MRVLDEIKEGSRKAPLFFIYVFGYSAALIWSQIFV